jgi:hypothetical protein
MCGKSILCKSYIQHLLLYEDRSYKHGTYLISKRCYIQPLHQIQRTRGENQWYIKVLIGYLTQDNYLSRFRWAI